MKQIELTEWKLMGSLPFQADFSKALQDGTARYDQTDWIDAQVPGCVYADLQRAGLIQDPYWGLNSLACEWVSNRWWIYRTEFRLGAEDLEDALKLTFAGIDYAAKIYLNGVFLGRHEGMYYPFDAIVNGAAKSGRNRLVCVLEHAPFCDAQPGYTSKTRYLKARFNYKWDFAVRLVSLGLYGAVTLTRHPLASLHHASLSPVRQDESWSLNVELELTAYRRGQARIKFELHAPDGTILYSGEEAAELREGNNVWRHTCAVDEPELWWPNGYGKQPLYRFSARVCDGDILSDRASWRVGFRTLEYFHADGRRDALPYGVKINGKRIYLKGTNLVPLDCMTGTVTEKRLRETLEAARGANINFLRIWGGGHLESEAFYSLCDELGLLVLQEFPMSSSGCDDLPSRDPDFLRLLSKAARYSLKWMRNHVSLTFLDGGNELTDFSFQGRPDHEEHPATFEDSTLTLLRGLVSEFCPGIQMLPSSGSGPNAHLNLNTLGQNHDVHGPWGYGGVHKHYELYNHSDSILHGEFGCGGISSLTALKRFLPPEELHLTTSRESRIWAHHSGGWDSYSLRERLMFGDLKHLPLEEYILINQYVQAEALRYALEANRRREWKNVGEMSWQFNEPWPNIQCSNILDYYGGKKLAWYFMRDAYAPVLASVRYDALFYSPGEEFHAQIWLTNDLPEAEYTLTYTITDLSGRPLLQEESGPVLRICEGGLIKEDVSAEICDISLTLPKDITGGFSITLDTACGSYQNCKEYLFLIADRTVPVHLNEEEQELFKRYPDFAANEPEGKRADTAPVLDYVKRYLNTNG